MTSDDIIRSHLMLHPDTSMDEDKYVFSLREIKQVVEATVKAEREACAALCDGWPDYNVQGLAEAIRARG